MSDPVRDDQRALLQLQLRYRICEVDKRIAIQRCEEYRRLLATYLGEGGIAQSPGESRSAVQAPTAVADPGGVCNSRPLVGPGPSAIPTVPVDRSLPPPSYQPPSLDDGTSGTGSSASRTDGGGLCAHTMAIGTSHCRRAALDAGPSPSPPRDALDDARFRAAAYLLAPVNFRRRAFSQGRTQTSLCQRTVPRLPSLLNNGPQSGPVSGVVPPVPPPVRANRFRSHAAARAFLREEGLEGSSLTTEDIALANMTPSVSLRRFTELFGGTATHERPNSIIRNIICINPDVQPYAPSAPGEPGVIFFVPGIIPHYEDRYEVFHIFRNVSPRTMDKAYKYLGSYRKVHVTHSTVEVDEWRRLPRICRDRWLWRIESATSPSMRADLARIHIQSKRPNGPPLSPDEIRQWVETRRYHGVSKSIVKKAWNSGEEKIRFEVVKCVRYDVEVARML